MALVWFEFSGLNKMNKILFIYRIGRKRPRYNLPIP